MPKAPKKSPRKPAKTKLKTLSPTKTGQVKGGAGLNTGSVNPIVISRDRSQGHG